MSQLKSEVAYLQGLTAGLNLNPETTEGKLFHGIIDILEKFASSFDELEKSHDKLEDYLEVVDQDLSDLENEIYGTDDEAEEETEYMEVECPNCHKTVCFDADVLEDDDRVEVVCPNCDEVVFINDDNLRSADEPEALEGRTAEAADGEEDL